MTQLIGKTSQDRHVRSCICVELKSFMYSMCTCKLLHYKNDNLVPKTSIGRDGVSIRIFECLEFIVRPELSSYNSIEP